MAKPGRPPLDATGPPRAAVCLKLRADDFDRAERMAKQNRESIQDLIRRGLKRLIVEERGGRI